MKAAVLYEYNSPLIVEDVEVQMPKEGEVLVRIVASGVCHSDLTASRGLSRAILPLILGHEAAGIVEKIGPSINRVSVGDHVVLSWAPNCGHCFYCRKTLPVMCDAYGAAGNAGGLWDRTSRLRYRGKTIHHYSCVSSFAEFAVVPEAGCIRIDDSISFDVAALVGCAVTTGFGAVVNDARVMPGDSVAVIGVGGVGVNAIHTAAVSGAHPVIAVDTDPQKESVAKKFGATHFLNPAQTDVVQAIREITGGRGTDAVIECTGNSLAMASGFEGLRSGGILVSVGIAPKDAMFSIPAASLPNSQKRIVGSCYGGGVPQLDIQKILSLYKAGRFELDAQVGKTIALEEINHAFDLLDKGVLARTVIAFGAQ